MSIFFATNSARDLLGQVDAYTGTPKARDGTLNTEEIGVDVASNNGQDKFSVPTFSSTNTLWVHFRVVIPTGGAEPTADGHVLHCMASNGVVHGGISLTDGDWKAQASTGTTGAGWSPAENTAYTIDYFLSTDGTDKTAELYADGVLVSSATASSTSQGIVDAVFTLNDAMGVSAGSGTYYFSEFMLDDTDSTIGRRVASMQPQSNGDNAAWFGDVTNLQSFGDSAYLYTDSTGRHNWELPAFGGATTGAVVAVIQASRGVSGSNGPTTMAQSLRIDGSNYDAASRTPPTGKFETFFDIWLTNPDTVAAWTFGDLADLQGGISAT